MFRWNFLFVAITAAFIGCEKAKPVPVDVPASQNSSTVDSFVPPFVVDDKPSEFIFDDSNVHELVGDGESVVVNGERYFLSRKAPPQHEAERRRALFQQEMQTIPRSEWPERIKKQAAAKARVSDYCTFPPYNQSQTNYCWGNGPCQAFTVARLQMGLPYRRISAASVCGPITGYRNVGGWELDAIEWLTKHGGTTEEAWPNTAINRAYNTTAVTADRQNYMALEWVELNGFDEFATAALNGFPCAVAYNWWSHVVMLCDLVEVSPGKFGFLIRNSWGDWGTKNEAGFYGFAVLVEGKGTPDSGFMLRQVRPSAKPTIAKVSHAAEMVEIEESGRDPMLTAAAPETKPAERRIVVHDAWFPCPPCERLKRETIPELKKVGWIVEIVHSKQGDQVDGIHSYPTIVCYLGDREIGRLVGFKTAAEIADVANETKKAPLNRSARYAPAETLFASAA